MMPSAYALTKHVAQNSRSLWQGETLRRIEAAPIYYFPDFEKFNCDDVEVAAKRLLREPLRLPHDTIVFEVADGHPEVEGLIVLVTQLGQGIEGYLVMSLRVGKRFSDVMAHASFRDGGFADVEINPRVTCQQAGAAYGETLTATVWRALAILSRSPIISDRHVPRTRRPKLARAGVKGWVWRLVDIDPTRMRSAAGDRGGSHASPRWHIRRGHWRTLSDGDRVFVRSCEVGDPALGGVVKDYRVTVGEIA